MNDVPAQHSQPFNREREEPVNNVPPPVLCIYVCWRIGASPRLISLFRMDVSVAPGLYSVDVDEYGLQRFERGGQKDERRAPSHP